MKFDRDEEFLHQKLADGLHPAAVDLWPAVAEHLPDDHAARRTRWLRLGICLAAPLLIAAGVLVGTAEFTNLRENPRPSFAPEANTGYAITYERQYFTLNEELLAGMVANHNGETTADGWMPMTGILNGQLHLSKEDEANRYSGGLRGYDTWDEVTQATGLPLAQNTLLDAGAENDNASIALYPSIMVALSNEDEPLRPYTPKSGEYTVGLVPIGRGDTPDKLYLRMNARLDIYDVELLAIVYLGDAPQETATELYWQKKAGLTWDCESYTMANGNTALIPHCTSNPNSMPFVQSTAYFEQDGILYQVYCRPYTDSLNFTADQEDIWTELKVVLDGFA